MRDAEIGIMYNSLKNVGYVRTKHNRKDILYTFKVSHKVLLRDIPKIRNICRVLISFSLRDTDENYFP